MPAIGCSMSTNDRVKLPTFILPSTTRLIEEVEVWPDRSVARSCSSYMPFRSRVGSKLVSVAFATGADPVASGVKAPVLPVARYASVQDARFGLDTEPTIEVGAV